MLCMYVCMYMISYNLLYHYHFHWMLANQASLVYIERVLTRDSNQWCFPICMYKCMYVMLCMYICYVCIYVYMCMYVYVCTYVCICMYVCAFACCISICLHHFYLFNQSTNVHINMQQNSGLYTNIKT